MTCPGGGIGGGGQPVRIDAAKRLARNQAMYADFLGEPLGHLPHELLHTSYQRRTF
jgi:iron only hydrogenase large subunit-like protein